MQRRMVSLESYVYNTLERVTNASQLSKEDEKADEVEVRREDQDKINRFSRLHQRELALNEELKTKNVRRQRDEILDTS
jgi:prefoldin subunit 4